VTDKPKVSEADIKRADALMAEYSEGDTDVRDLFAAMFAEVRAEGEAAGFERCRKEMRNQDYASPVFRELKKQIEEAFERGRAAVFRRQAVKHKCEERDCDKPGSHHVDVDSNDCNARYCDFHAAMYCATALSLDDVIHALLLAGHQVVGKP
jgi:hypothetical protein